MFWIFKLALLIQLKAGYCNVEPILQGFSATPKGKLFIADDVLSFSTKLPIIELENSLDLQIHKLRELGFSESLDFYHPETLNDPVDSSYTIFRRAVGSAKAPELCRSIGLTPVHLSSLEQTFSTRKSILLHMQITVTKNTISCFSLFDFPVTDQGRLEGDQCLEYLVNCLLYTSPSPRD